MGLTMAVSVPVPALKPGWQQWNLWVLRMIVNTADSITFHTCDNSAMGLYYYGLCLSPFLSIGTTSGVAQSASTCFITEHCSHNFQIISPLSFMSIWSASTKLSSTPVALLIGARLIASPMHLVSSPSVLIIFIVGAHLCSVGVSMWRLNSDGLKDGSPFCSGVQPARHNCRMFGNTFVGSHFASLSVSSCCCLFLFFFS